jgi:hypothetical protein
MPRIRQLRWTEQSRVGAADPLQSALRQPGFQMPRGRKKLTSLEIGRQMLEDIKKWINDGANPD